MEKSKRKFYRTVIQIEILSEEKYPDGVSLENINNDITDGHCSGQLTTTIDNEVKTGEEMVKLLKAQGSDPEFFNLDKTGNVLDEDEEYGQDDE